MIATAAAAALMRTLRRLWSTAWSGSGPVNGRVVMAALSIRFVGGLADLVEEFVDRFADALQPCGLRHRQIRMGDSSNADFVSYDVRSWVLELIRPAAPTEIHKTMVSVDGLATDETKIRTSDLLDEGTATTIEQWISTPHLWLHKCYGHGNSIALFPLRTSGQSAYEVWSDQAR